MQNVRPESFQRITTEALAKPFIEEQIKSIRETVGDKKVLLALSGGVDSSVVAALLIKAIGKQLVCVHVNHGLMRKDESEAVLEIFGKNMDANLIYVDATDRFLDKLAGVADPERKRKIIGKEFIEVFAEEARKLRVPILAKTDAILGTVLGIFNGLLGITVISALMLIISSAGGGDALESSFILKIAEGILPV